MKNTKGLSGVMTTLTIILVVIFFIGIAWIVISSFLEKPEFTITKEECFNESNEVRIDYKCENGNMGSLILLIPIKWNSIEEDCNFTFSYISNATCNQVEVGAFEIAIVQNQTNDYDEFEKLCWQMESKGNKYIFGCCRSQFGCGGWCCYDKKQSLSIDWLNENCECLKMKGAIAFWDCGENYLRTTTEKIKPNNNCNFDSWSGDYPCKKYKCGDYFVEVEK